MKALLIFLILHVLFFGALAIHKSTLNIKAVNETSKP